MFKNLFKKIEQKLDRFESNVKANFTNGNNVIREQNREIFDKVKHLEEAERVRKNHREIIESQQRTIDVLTNALCDKYNNGLFIYSEDGKIPTVIRNGKELTDDLTQEFTINWAIGNFPNINIEQIAGTHKDMDM